MSKLLNTASRYWYVLLVVVLLINSMVMISQRFIKPGYLAFSMIGEFASVGKTQIKLNNLVSKDKITKPSPLQKYGYLLLTQEVSHLTEINTADSSFTRIHPRFSDIYYQLDSDPSVQKKFTDLRLGELSYAEFDRLIQYYTTNKHRFDFWSGDYRNTRSIFKRYLAQLSQPEMKLQLFHSAGADSNITLVYRPSSIFGQLNLGGIPSEGLPISQILLSQAAGSGGIILAYLFLIALTLAMLYRAIKVMGRMGWMELGFLVLMLFPTNLIMKSLFWSNILGGITNQFIILIACALIFITPRPISKHPVWRYLFYLLLVVMFFGRSSLNMMYYVFGIGIFVLFIIQLLRQKGLQRRVMGRWFSLGFLPMLIFFAELAGIILLIIYALKPLLKLSGISISWLYYTGPVFSLVLDIILMSLFFLVTFIVFASPITGLIMGMLEFPIRLYYRFRRWLSGITVFGVFLVVVCAQVYFDDRLITRNFFVLFFLLFIGIALAWIAMRLFRFLDPVHHDERKALRNLLESSFAHNEEAEYFGFYSSFVKKLYPKTKLALAKANCTVMGDNFHRPEPEMLAAIPVQGYFNLDLARIDHDPVSKVFPEWIPPKRKKHKKNAEPEAEDTSKHGEVRLYFPLTDSQNNATGHLYFGESGKLYWDKENADFIAETVQIFNSFLNNINLNTSYREEQVKLERERQERILNEQLAQERELRNQELQEFNRKIMDSINYASLIQRSILPNEAVLKSYLKDYFIIWRPRDVVGGDYYWFYPIPEQNMYLLAVIDCTGHGVPGAFMTLMTNSILNSIVRDRKIYAPNQIISHLHTEVRYTLQQGQKDSMKDGLDISLILVDLANHKISFSGAKHKAMFFTSVKGEPEVQVFVGHKYSLGGTRECLEPELQELSYLEGDLLYLLTDGLIDQPIQHDNALKRMIFNEWLEVFRKLALTDFTGQKTYLNSYIQSQLELHEQRDDITLLGIKL